MNRASPPLIEPASRTIPTLIDELALRYCANEALVVGDSRYSYADLKASVRQVAKGLMALGVEKGDHVAILMGNKAEWVISDLAIASIGAVMVAVSTWVTSSELQYIISHSDTDTLIYDTKFLKYDYVSILSELEPLGASVPSLKRLVHLGTHGHGSSISFGDLIDLGNLVADEEFENRAAQVQPSDLAAILYTSGSTSTPKGVQLLHNNIIENMWHLGNRMYAGPTDRIWSPVSMFWGLGCLTVLFSSLTHGCCLITQDKVEPAEALRLLEKERVTILYGVGSLITSMASHPDFPSRNLGQLRVGNFADNQEIMDAMRILGVAEPCGAFGMTEVYGLSHVTDVRHDSAEKVTISCGRPLEGVVQRIVNPETNEVLAPGKVGELQLSGRVTPGYYKDKDKNADAFTADGFLRTGDLGEIDEEGYLIYRGRIKELIKANGISVSPTEVEQAILANKDVEAAFVVGVPDALRGETVGAVIVQRSGTPEQLEQALRAELPKKLSSYKLPQSYIFIGEGDIPFTNTGKVKKRELVNLFLQSRGE